jgi:hypothetical protein
MTSFGPFKVFHLKYSTTEHNFIGHYFALHNNRHMKLYYHGCMDNKLLSIHRVIQLHFYIIFHTLRVIQLHVFVIVHTPRGIQLHLSVIVYTPREIISISLLLSIHPGEYCLICLLFSIHTGLFGPFKVFHLKYSTTEHNFIGHYFALHNNRHMKLYYHGCMDNKRHIKAVFHWVYKK